MTAYQAEQRTRLRAVFFSQQQQQKKRRAGEGSWTLLSPPVNTREVSGVGRRVLDREFLMRHCFVERPSDLSHADITGVHQNTVSYCRHATLVDHCMYICYEHVFSCVCQLLELCVFCCSINQRTSVSLTASST